MKLALLLASLLLSESVNPELTALEAERAAVTRAPEQALTLAADFEKKFPTSAHLDEVVLLKVRALVNLNRIAEMHREARLFTERFPRSAFLPELERLTGFRRRPTPGPQVTAP
jgi:hypothetical protein